MVTQRLVEASVGRLHRRDEDQDVAAGRCGNLGKAAQRCLIVFNVLEDIDAEDGVEALADQRRAVALLEMTVVQRECRMVADRLPQVSDRGTVRLDADDAVGHLHQCPCRGTDARADLEHARADVRTKKGKHMALVAPCLPHRGEIVGGKVHPGLNVSPVDIHRLAHDQVSTAGARVSITSRTAIEAKLRNGTTG